MRRFEMTSGRLVVAVMITILWASAAHGIEIRIPPLVVKSGESVEIPIMIDRIDNLAGIKLVMKYDPEILHFKEAQKTTYSNALMHIVNDKTPGTLIVVMAGAQGIKGEEFPIMRLYFETKEGFETNHSTAIEITEVELMSDQLKRIDCRVKVHPLVIVP